MSRSLLDNVGRRMQTPGGNRDITDIVVPLLDTRGTRLATAVVSDFISNVDALEESERETLREQVQNSQFIDKMAMNSVIAYVIPDSSATGKPAIFYPFFSGHLCMPVKAGEQIWVIYDDFSDSAALGYWLCRKSTNIDIDDLNYTHIDRIDNRKAGSAESWESSKSIPGFPEGGFRFSDRTLPNNTSYDVIVSESVDYATFVGESVPRFNRRGSDLAIQGSNNTLICLGENFINPARSQNGLIDIVVGRGNLENVNSAKETVNTRDYAETDKRTPNPTEGERDLRTDSARISVFMSAQADTTTDSMMNYWRNIGVIGAKKSAPDGSLIISKADNLRFVANNSIFLLRDSSGGSEGMIVDSSGDVQIRGNNIFLGKSSAREPFIKYSVYKDTIDAVVDTIDLICSAVASVAPPAKGLGQALKAVVRTNHERAKSLVIFGE